MIWKDIKNLKHEDDYIENTKEARVVILFFPVLEFDPDFPGLSYSLSNILYAKGNAINEGASKYAIVEKPSNGRI